MRTDATLGDLSVEMSGCLIRHYHPITRGWLIRENAGEWLTLRVWARYIHFGKIPGAAYERPLPPAKEACGE